MAAVLFGGESWFMTVSGCWEELGAIERMGGWFVYWGYRECSRESKSVGFSIIVPPKALERIVTHDRRHNAEPRQRISPYAIHAYRMLGLNHVQRPMYRIVASQPRGHIGPTPHLLPPLVAGIEIVHPLLVKHGQSPSRRAITWLTRK